MMKKFRIYWQHPDGEVDWAAGFEAPSLDAMARDVAASARAHGFLVVDKTADFAIPARSVYRIEGYES